MKLKMDQAKKIIVNLREPNLIRMVGSKRRKEVVDAADNDVLKWNISE